MHAIFMQPQREAFFCSPGSVGSKRRAAGQCTRRRRCRRFNPSCRCSTISSSSISKTRRRAASRSSRTSPPSAPGTRHAGNRNLMSTVTSGRPMETIPTIAWRMPGWTSNAAIAHGTLIALFNNPATVIIGSRRMYILYCLSMSYIVAWVARWSCAAPQARQMREFQQVLVKSSTSRRLCRWNADIGNRAVCAHRTWAI